MIEYVAEQELDLSFADPPYIQDVELPPLRYRPVRRPRPFIMRDPAEEEERERIKTVALTRLLGPTAYATFPVEHRRIADILLHEITRPGDGRRPDHPGGAKLLIRNTASETDPQEPADGHLLRQDGRQVALWATGGNPLRGCGTRFLADRGGGWLSHCWAVMRGSSSGAWLIEESLLLTIERVADLLRLRLSCYDYASQQELAVYEASRMARFAGCIRHFNYMYFRVAPCHEYLWALSSSLDTQDELVAGRPTNEPPADFMAPDEVFDRLSRLAIQDCQLASVLRVSKSYVSHLRHGRFPWSPRLLAKAAAFVTEAEGDLVATIDGAW